MSLFSRLRSVVSGDDYLEDDYDELEYDTADESEATPSPSSRSSAVSSALAPLDSGFSSSDPFAGTNVIGMPGIAAVAAEISLMEPRSFDEMPAAIQALRDRKTIILNLTMMEPDQAQRAVDFVAGGTFAIDGHQERVGESIFLFAPSCITVTTSDREETSSTTVVNSPTPAASDSSPAPAPAWSRSAETGLSAGV
ncbi:DUF552 domain-containing protein [Synechococcus sp. RSCCF101]|uniref:cell division protein SepF n=1 Tax=Synechococcus sp. RSCCF101 TaxID=2511069 RepID=UPI001245A6F9|nr:cell division protein SepF [Synechococcus sp. RSCCF101]QEY32082.1 DUF552 domain-containing protein [Synechococcus sp. RSCCF101]